jgi:hypothetical protein
MAKGHFRDIYSLNRCNIKLGLTYRGADKSLTRPGRKQATATEDFDVHIYPIYNHNWRHISTIHIYITRLASNEIFSLSNKIHWEVGRAKDLSVPPYNPFSKKGPVRA